MNYVYVPYHDVMYETFAGSLVSTKNENASDKLFGKYKRLPKEGGAATGPGDLTPVGFGDRLYVLIHGQDVMGVGAYTTGGGGSPKKKVDITGEALADFLIAHGLRNKRIDLRLWTCSGGQDAPTAAEGFGGRIESFAARVHAQLHARGLKAIQVCGYLLPVILAQFLGDGPVKAADGHKLLLGADKKPVRTTGHKVFYPRASII